MGIWMLTALTVIGSAWGLTVGNVEIEPTGQYKLTDQNIVSILNFYGKYDLSLRFLKNRPHLHQSINLQRIEEKRRELIEQRRLYDMPKDSFFPTKPVNLEEDVFGQMICLDPGKDYRLPGVHGFYARLEARILKREDGKYSVVSRYEVPRGGMCGGTVVEAMQIGGAPILAIKASGSRAFSWKLLRLVDGRLEPLKITYTEETEPHNTRLDCRDLIAEGGQVYCRLADLSGGRSMANAGLMDIIFEFQEDRLVRVSSRAVPVEGH